MKRILLPKFDKKKNRNNQDPCNLAPNIQNHLKRKQKYPRKTNVHSFIHQLKRICTNTSYCPINSIEQFPLKQGFRD